MLEGRTAVEADAGNAGNDEFDRQHVALFAGWEITGCTVDGAYCAVGKRLGVEAGGRLGVLVIPDANRVLCDRIPCHCESFSVPGQSRPVALPLSNEQAACGFAPG